MTKEQIDSFFHRIDQLTPDLKPRFGKMNAHQMVCHCTDQIRLALGTIVAEEYGALSPEEVIALAKARKTVPAAKGLGQVEGGGTAPTNFEDDIKNLKQHILSFVAMEKEFDYKQHPYFGEYDKEQWNKMTIYHLNHHFRQFGV